MTAASSSTPALTPSAPVPPSRAARRPYDAPAAYPAPASALAQTVAATRLYGASRR
ncbi:hypothetical protein [Streptomyces sp. NPDC001678]|uniref:hypothetical protein n=1 Tax=Streptomyces sp. NPDC001678 TaxID=3364599 RepID=UPI0036A68F22